MSYPQAEQDLDHLVRPINKLSRPKGEQFACEISGNPAQFEYAPDGKVISQYCCYEHFRIDYKGIKARITDDLAVLKEEPNMIGSEEERARREEELKAIRQELLHLCIQTAQGFLVKANYQLAVPGALQALKLAREIYGHESLNVVPSQLLLAEAFLGHKDIEKRQAAEEFLSLANWNLLKNKEHGSSMMSQLHRNFGRLYTAQLRYNEALHAFAMDIYYSSLEHGPEHIRTAPSYFHMGRVFQNTQKKQAGDKKSEKASYFYALVVKIYTKCLQQWVDDNGIVEASQLEITAVEVEEGIEIVTSILKTEDKRSEERADSGAAAARKMVMDCRYLLGLFIAYDGDLEAAKTMLGDLLEKAAGETGAYGPGSDEVALVNKVLDQIGQRSESDLVPASK
eukprot:gene936-587_t